MQKNGAVKRCRHKMCSEYWIDKNSGPAGNKGIKAENQPKFKGIFVEFFEELTLN